ncbi:unnamed protein product [Vitrella brassicaformis CCMP3155]|uniref:PROP1-like PPR domain-containing protein n=3 Tax=Vitrella brassicaformis TaxID=1169539 RepID=A0A0G4FNW7_VITBC|nr:unnamed protein product [Vitrella brassicaformis CCMP3155]|eukprot:CEM15885.1 unnamed protein product [Vitrella brassicaformis CCMP3155]
MSLFIASGASVLTHHFPNAVAAFLEAPASNALLRHCPSSSLLRVRRHRDALRATNGTDAVLAPPSDTDTDTPTSVDIDATLTGLKTSLRRYGGEIIQPNTPGVIQAYDDKGNDDGAGGREEEQPFDEDGLREEVLGASGGLSLTDVARERRGVNEAPAGAAGGGGPAGNDTAAGGEEYLSPMGLDWERAFSLVDEQQEIDPMLVAFNAALSAFDRQGRGKEAMEAVKEMWSVGVKPDMVTYTAAMSACCKAHMPQEVKQLQEWMSAQALKPDVVIYNIMLESATHDNDWVGAASLYEEMKKDPTLEPTELSYLHILTVMDRAERPDLAIQYLTDYQAAFHRMTPAVLNAVLSSLAKSGWLTEAMDIWQRVVGGDGETADATTYRLMLIACVNARSPDMAEEIWEGFQTSQHWAQRDASHFLYALRAAAIGGDFERAYELMSGMQDHGLQAAISHFEALIQACREAGEWRGALQALRRLSAARMPPTPAMYEDVMAACARVGDWEPLLGIFSEMTKSSGLSPTPLTVHYALDACFRLDYARDAGQLVQTAHERRLTLLPSTLTLIDKWRERSPDVLSDDIMPPQLLEAQRRRRIGGGGAGPQPMPPSPSPSQPEPAARSTPPEMTQGDRRDERGPPRQPERPQMRPAAPPQPPPPRPSRLPPPAAAPLIRPTMSLPSPPPQPMPGIERRTEEPPATTPGVSEGEGGDALTELERMLARAKMGQPLGPMSAPPSGDDKSAPSGGGGGADEWERQLDDLVAQAAQETRNEMLRQKEEARKGSGEEPPSPPPQPPPAAVPDGAMDVHRDPAARLRFPRLG